MNIEDKINSVCKFYGVDWHTFKLDNHIYEVLEDPSDGYRSYMEAVVIKQEKELIFFKKSLAKVVVKQVECEHFDGYYLVDSEDKHTWLIFGTDYTDDYYPCFVFRYTPKPGE